MRHNFKFLVLGASFISGLLLVNGCTNEEITKPLDNLPIEERGLTNGTPVSTALIGLTPGNELVNLLSGPPAVDLGTIPITGLRVEEVMQAIDTRPRTKQLFGVSNMSILYRIDAVTGAATPVGPAFSPKINGSLVGFDFNPTDDLIRIVTDLGQNIRLSPTTGLVVGVDVNINSFTAAMNSIAYSYTIPGARSTLYDIDIAGGVVYKQSPPNSGALQWLGPTNFYFSGEGGFDITGGNVGFAVQYGRSRTPQGSGGVLGGGDDTTQDAYRLYNINLRTGAATSYGKVRPMIGLAVK